MTGKKTTENECLQRVQDIIEKEKLDYNVLSVCGEFQGVKTKIKVRCNKCHYIYEVKFNNFFNGKRCAKCKGVYHYTKEERRKQIQYKIDTEKLPYQFMDFAETFHGRTTKMEIRCKRCNYLWHVSIAKFLDNRNCPFCSANMRYTLEERKAQIIDIINNESLPYKLLGFDSNEYFGANLTHVILYCKKHDIIWKPSVNMFINGSTRCSLCSEKSKGELMVHLYLNSLGIEHIREKRFKDCKYKKSLPFDFYLPQHRICIEYDGRQHFRPERFGNISEELARQKFEELKIKDNIKNEYCKKHNITLLRIPYTATAEEAYEMINKTIKNI